MSDFKVGIWFLDLSKVTWLTIEKDSYTRTLSEAAEQAGATLMDLATTQLPIIVRDEESDEATIFIVKKHMAPQYEATPILTSTLCADSPATSGEIGPE